MSGRRMVLVGTGDVFTAERSTRRLQRLLQAPLTDFARIVLVERWGGVTSRGTAYPGGQARAQAALLWEELPADASVLVIGPDAIAAFEVTSRSFLSWRDLTRNARTRPLATMPAPLSHWWLVDTNAAKAGRFFTR